MKIRDMGRMTPSLVLCGMSLFFMSFYSFVGIVEQSELTAWGHVGEEYFPNGIASLIFPYYFTLGR